MSFSAFISQPTIHLRLSPHHSSQPPLSSSSQVNNRHLISCPFSYHRSLGLSSSFLLQRRNRITSSWLQTRASSVAKEVPPLQTSTGGDDKEEKRVGSDLPTLLRRFWKVAAPYWSSEDKVQARLRIAVIFIFTVGTTGVHVVFNFLQRDFFNALASKNKEQFTRQLLYNLGAFAVGIPVFILKNYFRRSLSLRWRSWMTNHYMQLYLKNQIFYKIQSQSTIDNPDQRIVDDINSFTETTLSFSLILLNVVMDFISFSGILYGIYPPLFIVLLVYSIGGTAITIFLGKGLANLKFMQKKKEADFRYGLVRVRENAESVAFYGGEGNEMQLLLQRFRQAFENSSKLLIATRNLELFTFYYKTLIDVLPDAIAAPMYFSGKIEMGVVQQCSSAFYHIFDDFSLIVNHFQYLSGFSAVIDRLGEFEDVLDGSDTSYLLESQSNVKIRVLHESSQKFLHHQSDLCGPSAETKRLLGIHNLTLETPKTRRILIGDLSIEISCQDHLLVRGASGTGKTSLLRALAGLWTTGEGNIVFYLKTSGKEQLATSSDATSEQEANMHERAEDIFFLPQKPYMVLGTLREQLLYPTWSRNSWKTSESIQSSNIYESLPWLLQMLASDHASEHPSEHLKKPPTTDDLIQVLETVHLGDIASRFNGLDTICDWSTVLSLGEQQRLAFARLLLSRPRLVLLDESTSALDEANEAHLYKQIKDSGITYISIGHRRTLYKYHNRVLHISELQRNDNQKNWHLQSIEESTAHEP